MQAHFGNMFQDDPANAMHNAFRRARRAAGIKDIERIIEIDRCEAADRRRCLQGGIKQGGLRQAGQVWCRVEKRDDQHMRHRGQGSGQVAQDCHCLLYTSPSPRD